MKSQPEALRLADALRDGNYLLSVERDATEKELRRLSAIQQAAENLVKVKGRCLKHPVVVAVIFYLIGYMVGKS